MKSRDTLVALLEAAESPKAIAILLSDAIKERDLEIERLEEEALDYQLLRTASKQCSGSPKHFGGCSCLCHGGMGND